MKRSNDFVVGLVIVLAAVALMGATMWVNQTDIGDKRTRVTARFRDVGGVQVGAPVVIRGVRSGKVERIELTEAGWVRIRMTLDPRTSLPADPVVVLNASSLFGEWNATILDRSGLPNDRDVLRQVADARGGRDGELAGATLPDIAQLTAVAGRIAGDVASVAGRVDVAFDEHAATDLRASIKNFSELSGDLARAVRVQSRNMDVIAAGMRSGVGALDSAALAIRNVATRADTSIRGEQVEQMMSDVSRAASDMRAATAQLHAMADRLEQSGQRVDAVVARTDSVMAKINAGQGSLGLLVNDPSLYHSSDTLMREARKALADFQANPKKYVNVRIF